MHASLAGPDAFCCPVLSHSQICLSQSNVVGQLAALLGHLQVDQSNICNPAARLLPKEHVTYDHCRTCMIVIIHCLVALSLS